MLPRTKASGIVILTSLIQMEDVKFGGNQKHKWNVKTYVKGGGGRVMMWGVYECSRSEIFEIY